MATLNPLARLRSLDCCALSDALDRLRLSGQVTHLARRSAAGRVAGRVLTVKLGTGMPPPGPPRHLGTTAIEMAGPENIIVLEQRSGLEAACWGGLLTLGASLRGVAGVVADGPVRDIDEAIDLNFPIFSSSVTSYTARGRVVEEGTDIPIRVGNVMVHPGDYVMADSSAVVFVRECDIQNVLAAAEEIVAREKAMAAAIRAGTPIGSVMGGNYEGMLT